VYYGVSQLGDGLAQGGEIGIALGVWLSNLTVGAVALFMLTRLTRMTAFGRLSDRPISKSKEPKALPDGELAPLRPKRWSLQRYVALRFLQTAAISFVVVLAAYLLVDVLERMRWLSYFGATPGDLLQYYSARIPLLASRVMPMSLLVATALTVSLLAAQGELMGMRACGVSLGRALLPILIICGLMVPTYFVLSDQVLPRTNALARYVKTVVIKGRALPGEAGMWAWYRIGNKLYQAEYLDPQSGRARDISVFELGDDGLPINRLDASQAWHIGMGVWRLEDPIRSEVTDTGVVQLDAGPFAKLGEEVPAEVDTRQLSMQELRGEIQFIEDAGQNANSLWVDYWSKLSAPVACLLLPALALFFAVAGPPHPSSATTLVLSVIVSITYILLTGVGTSLGYGEKLSPFVAGFASTMAFGVLTLYLGMRLRGTGQSF
jgi:lipopolysaccharide export system permease protein